MMMMIVICDNDDSTMMIMVIVIIMTVTTIVINSVVTYERVEEWADFTFQSVDLQIIVSNRASTEQVVMIIISKYVVVEAVMILVGEWIDGYV